MPKLKSREEVADSIFSTLGTAYGQDDVSREFAIDPSMVQQLEKKRQESNAFLKRITVRSKASKEAQIINTFPTERMTKRTKTGRRPTDPMGMADRKYYCETAEKDALISWEKVDDWKGHTDGDMYREYRASVLQAMTNDDLKTMWWGQSSAETTSQDFEFLEDQMPGFFQYMFDVAPEQCMGITVDSNDPRGYTVKTIKLDAEAADADFKTLDQLIYHARMEKIKPLHRERTDIRSIIGSQLIMRENFRMYGISTTAHERNQLDVYMANQEFGQTPHVKSDHFPMRGVFITPLSNLARYYLVDSYRRKAAEDNHEMKGIIDYNYNVEDLVVEDIDQAMCIHPDAILLIDPAEAEDSPNRWKPASYLRSTSDITTWKV